MRKRLRITAKTVDRAPVFKPSTDAGRLLGSIKKKVFDSGEGFAWERLAKWGRFRFFDQL